MFKNFKILSGTKDYWSNFFTRQHVIQWELFSSDFVEQVPGEIRGVHEHGSEPGTDPLQPVDPGNPTQSPGHQEGHQGSDCHVLRAGGRVRQHDGGQGQEAYLSFLFVISCFLCIEYFHLFHTENKLLFACHKILPDLKENPSREYFWQRTSV